MRSLKILTQNNGVKTENLSDNIMLETILRKQRDDQYARKTRQNVQRVSDLIIEFKVTAEENKSPKVKKVHLGQLS